MKDKIELAISYHDWRKLEVCMMTHALKIPQISYLGNDGSPISFEVSANELSDIMRAMDDNSCCLQLKDGYFQDQGKKHFGW